MAYDTYFASVTHLLHFNGTNGSTTFSEVVDNAGHAFTAVGNAQISTAQSLYGGASGLFDGTGDYLASTFKAGDRLGASDFAVEFAARQSASGAIQMLIDTRGSAGGDAAAAWVLLSSATGKVTFKASTTASGSSGSWAVTLTSTTSISSSGFTRGAITRSGSTWRLFIEGTQEATASASITIGAEAATAYWASGVIGVGSIGYNYNGYIDELRISKITRYTANYTPDTGEFGDSAYPDNLFTRVPLVLSPSQPVFSGPACVGGYVPTHHLNL
jgi:hypothetical protein